MPTHTTVPFTKIFTLKKYLDPCRARPVKRYDDPSSNGPGPVQQNWTAFSTSTKHESFGNAKFVCWTGKEKHCNIIYIFINRQESFFRYQARL